MTNSSTLIYMIEQSTCSSTLIDIVGYCQEEEEGRAQDSHNRRQKITDVTQKTVSQQYTGYRGGIHLVIDEVVNKVFIHINLSTIQAQSIVIKNYRYVISFRKLLVCNIYVIEERKSWNQNLHNYKMYCIHFTDAVNITLLVFNNSPSSHTDHGICLNFMDSLWLKHMYLNHIQFSRNLRYCDSLINIAMFYETSCVFISPSFGEGILTHEFWNTSYDEWKVIFISYSLCSTWCHYAVYDITDVRNWCRKCNATCVLLHGQGLSCTIWPVR